MLNKLLLHFKRERSSVKVEGLKGAIELRLYFTHVKVPIQSRRHRDASSLYAIDIFDPSAIYDYLRLRVHVYGVYKRQTTH